MGKASTLKTNKYEANAVDKFGVFDGEVLARWLPEKRLSMLVFITAISGFLSKPHKIHNYINKIHNSINYIQKKIHLRLIAAPTNQ